MMFLNNFIPVRLYYSSEFDSYRLQPPLADREEVVYDEDFLMNVLPKSYALVTTFHVLNPRIFPPVPLGTSMFNVYQNHNHPYETSYIEWVAFPIMSNVYTEIGNFAFFAFTTSPVLDSYPIYIRNEDIKCMIATDQKIIADYFLTTPYYNKVIDRDNFVIYVHPNVHLYWRGTTECLCVPSDNPKHFETLVECQRTMYPKIKNRVSYTGNSALPLAWIRDRIFPQQPPNIYKYVYALLVIVLILMSIFIYRQKQILSFPRLKS